MGSLELLQQLREPPVGLLGLVVAGSRRFRGFCKRGGFCLPLTPLVCVVGVQHVSGSKCFLQTMRFVPESIRVPAVGNEVWGWCLDPRRVGMRPD